MSKSNQDDRVPEEFTSLEEAGKFWDTHDTTEYASVFRTVQQGKKAQKPSTYWKNPSVLKFASGRDPIEAITAKAQEVVFKALEEGWQGPPFDPFKLAKILNIRVVPRDDIRGDALRDARTVPDSSGELTIEYNPNKPTARIRYSICHEIAHSFFSDCAEGVRYRLAPEEMHGTERQLEMLCNFGAAELLMPIGSFPQFPHKLTMPDILEWRKKFEVSTEAVLLRAIKLSEDPLAAFGAAVLHEGSSVRRYRLEYCVGSKAWKPGLRPGFILPPDTVLAQCTAVGYTAKGTERWGEGTGQIDVEGVGVPPYPDQSYPRVVGVIRQNLHVKSHYPTITYLVRDATDPLDAGPTLIAHIVNDRTPNWGAGFGRFLSMKWPQVQENFKSAWADKGGLHLGQVFLTQVSPALGIVHMVSQHGYGNSPKPRIRYEALRRCLEQLAGTALLKNAKVQMPKIGIGEARGSWAVIQELIQEALCRRGIGVTVCELPGPKAKGPAQLDLIEEARRSS